MKFVCVSLSLILGAGNTAFAATKQSISAGVIIGFYPVHDIGIQRYDISAIVIATKENREYFGSVMNIVDSEEDNNNNYDKADYNYL